MINEAKKEYLDYDFFVQNMKDIFSLLEPDFDLNVIKDKMGLDYIL